MEIEDVVWTSMLDRKYTVVVARVAPYVGELRIEENDKVLHSRRVRLSFDALFGPDVAEVAEWQDIAIQFVDGLSLTSRRALRRVKDRRG